MDSFSRQYGSGITWCSSRVAVTVPGTLAARLRPLSRSVMIQDPVRSRSFIDVPGDIGVSVMRSAVPNERRLMSAELHAARNGGALNPLAYDRIGGP